MIALKKSVLLMAALVMTGSMLPNLSHAQDASPKTLQEQLDERKETFTKNSDPQKVEDYEQGIKELEQSGVLERAKNTGDTAPDFTLPNAIGGTVTLSELLAQGPVVLIWYRGEWCPYCNIYLKNLQDNAEAFNEAGAQIVAISPETPEHAVSVSDTLDLGYHVLSDEKSKVAEEYGVVYTLPPKIASYLQEAFDLKSANNDDRNLLPLAASYVINQNGVISYAYLNADYRQRADTSVLLEEVKKLKSGENQ